MESATSAASWVALRTSGGHAHEMGARQGDDSDAVHAGLLEDRLHELRRAGCLPLERGIHKIIYSLAASHAYESRHIRDGRGTLSVAGERGEFFELAGECTQITPHRVQQQRGSVRF